MSLRELFFWLFWMKSCWTGPQRRTHCTCQKLLRAAVGVCHPLHLSPSPIHPSGWCAHIVMQSQKTHTNTLSKASLEPKLSAICESIFYSSITCNQQKKHTCVFLHMNLQTLRRDAELNGLLTLCSYTWAGTPLNTHLWVSEWACAIFLNFMQLCFKHQIVHFSYLLRAKQMDMTIRVSFIWCYHGTKSFHTHTHTHT